MVSRREAMTCLLGAGLCSVLGLWAAGQSSPTSLSPKRQAWGYLPFWMKNGWPNMSLPVWDRVVLFEFPILAGGGIEEPDDWYSDLGPLAQGVHNAGLSLDLAYTLMDAETIDLVFSQQQRRKLLVDAIRAAADRSDVVGVHLDIELYEGVPDGAVAGFREFVGSVAQSLKSLDHAVTLSVFMPTGTKRELFDARTLQDVDYVVVQGYDAHWAGSTTAGPVAPLRGPDALTWEKSLGYVLDLGVPRTKVLFSIPYFGYEWPVVSDQPRAVTIGRGEIITYAPVDPMLLPRIRISALERVAHYPVKRDADTGSAYYVYQSSAGQWYQGWFEDQFSLAEKFDFIIRENLCGVAVFPLGYDGGSFDALIQEKFGLAKRG